MHVSPAVGVHWWGIVQTSGVDPAVIGTATRTRVLEDTPQKPINKQMPRVTNIWHWPTYKTEIKLHCFKSHSLVQTKPEAGCSCKHCAFLMCLEALMRSGSRPSMPSPGTKPPAWAENPSFANGPYIIYELQIDTLWANQS